MVPYILYHYELNESLKIVERRQIMSGVMPLDELLDCPTVIKFFAILPMGPITPIRYTFSLTVPKKATSVFLANWHFKASIPLGQCSVFLNSMIKTIRNVRGSADSLMTLMMKSRIWYWSSAWTHC